MQVKYSQLSHPFFFHLLQINEKQCLLTCCQEFQRIDEQYTIRLETSIGKA